MDKKRRDVLDVQKRTDLGYAAAERMVSKAAHTPRPDYGLRYDWLVVETARDEYGVADRNGSIFVASLDLETATLIAAAPALLLSMKRMEAMSRFVGSEAMRGEASTAILRATEGK